MGRLSRFEDKLEQLVSGVFARTFRSAVQPVEIAAQLAREADKSAQVLSRDRRIISNIFHVELSPSDHDNLDRLGPQLPAELADALKSDRELRAAFDGLTPGRQRSYVIALASAKTSATRLNRIARFRPKIVAGKGATER